MPAVVKNKAKVAAAAKRPATKVKLSKGKAAKEGKKLLKLQAKKAISDKVCAPRIRVTNK